jgi:RHS repeat-associated protein
MLAYTDEVIDTSIRNLIRNSYQTISYESVYDILGRKEKEELTIGNTKRSIDFTYRRPDNDPNKTSFEINQVSTLTNQNIDYVYDDLGNVKMIQTLDGIYEYDYDFMGRLVEEYNPVLNQTIKITYDNQNIAYKKYYAGQSSTLVKQMEYLTNNEDQLLYLGITENGNETPLSISYDSKYIGNPTQIGNKSLVWEGRRLKEISSDNIHYTYNEQGIRTSKDVDGVITKYYLRDKDIIAEETGGVKTVFIYNDENELIGFEYQGNYYFYEKDLLGNITNIIDTNGIIMVTYKYDAWGNWINKSSASNGTSLGDTLVIINPFIYKGYYYDKETDWYYLKSRYYCPKLSRFINMDHVDNLEPGEHVNLNGFIYCANNPVMHIDENGNKWWKKVIKVVAIVAITAVVVTAVVASAGGAAALAGVGASLLGASAGTASVVASTVTVGSFIVAGGIAAIGVNEAIDAGTGNNIIRDNIMSGNQKAYDITKYTLLGAGALIITAGVFAPSILKNSFTDTNFNGNNLKLSGQDPYSILTNTRRGGYQTNIFDKLGNWSCRIDAYIHDGHINPHVHFGSVDSKGIEVRNIWEAIKHLFGL